MGVLGSSLSYNGFTGEIFTSSSSRRYKTDIADVQASESARVWDLRPVSYHAIDAEEGTDKIYGFIAEEVEQVDPRLCFYSKVEEGQLRVEGVHYIEVIPLLLQEMKTLRSHMQEVDALRVQDIDALKGRIKVLEEQIAAT